MGSSSRLAGRFVPTATDRNDSFWGGQLSNTGVDLHTLPPSPPGQVGMARVDRAARVAKGPKPRSALSAASTPVRGALIAFMAATSEAQAEATKAAQPSRCCSTESTSTPFRYQGAGSIDDRHEGEPTLRPLPRAARPTGTRGPWGRLGRRGKTPTQSLTTTPCPLRPLGQVGRRRKIGPPCPLWPQGGSPSPLAPLGQVGEAKKDRAAKGGQG
jgi:hypothetical protein